MAWSGISTATQLTNITTEQFFDDKPQLNPGETAHVSVDVNFASTNGDAIVSVYAGPSTSNWDDTPFFQMALDSATDPNQGTFLVSGVYQFRVGVQEDGSTSLTSADMRWRTDGVSI